jgi:hypothetical protein
LARKYKDYDSSTDDDSVHEECKSPPKNEKIRLMHSSTMVSSALNSEYDNIGSNN